MKLSAGRVGKSFGSFPFAYLADSVHSLRRTEFKERGYRLRNGRKIAIYLCVLLVTTLVKGRAAAHNLNNSLVLLDFQREAVAAELVLPWNELEQAVGLPAANPTAAAVEREGARLRNYLLTHVQPVAPDGGRWDVEIRGMSVAAGQPLPDLVVQLWMRPPVGAPLRRFTLNYSVICAEVPSHSALVSVRNDWNNATFASQPKLLGVMQTQANTLTIDRTRGSFWAGFGAVFALGMRHIAGGLDHLLFLFALLLPAPLRAVGRRWTSFRGINGSFGQLLKIVTAFTLGHSLTLVLGSVGWVQLPGRPVEILIALSILVSALHALRPWFPGREPWVAGGFGLVHGLAFSSSIAGFGFTPWYLAMTILGFNLGIEAMQLVIVLAMVPPLLLAARSGPAYTPWRVAGACLAGGTAVAWMGERLLGS